MRATAQASATNTIDLDFASSRDRFMPDEPAALQRLIFDQLTSQPGGYLLDPADGPELRTLDLPMTYLLAEREHASWPRR